MPAGSGGLPELIEPMLAAAGPVPEGRLPAPIAPAPGGEVEGALQTLDGRWRVEVIRRGRDRFYRLVHGDNVIDGLFIATVERLLREAGVDMADLVEAPTQPDTPMRRHGAA